MHGTTRTRPASQVAATGVNAVVWIGGDRALLVRGTPDGDPDVTESRVPASGPSALPALAELAHRIGEVDRVLVLGQDELRTALEREIVAIGHRPETIREAAFEGPADTHALIARLHRFA